MNKFDLLHINENPNITQNYAQKEYLYTLIKTLDTAIENNWQFLQIEHDEKISNTTPLNSIDLILDDYEMKEITKNLKRMLTMNERFYENGYNYVIYIEEDCIVSRCQFETMDGDNVIYNQTIATKLTEKEYYEQFEENEEED